MKKILLASETNLIAENLYVFLSSMFMVQICEPENDVINRFVKMIKPDLIIAIKTANVEDAVFRNLRADIRQIPIICACNNGESCAEKYAGQNLSFIYKPIDNEQLLDRITQLLGSDEVDAAASSIQIKAEVSNDESALSEDMLGFSLAELASMDRKKRILAIDDNPMVLRGLKQLLDGKYEIALATSVALGEKQIEKKEFDLILLDYEMPDMDGFSALQRFKANPKTMSWPVVFLTGVSDKKRISEVVSLKPAGYLLKPIDADMLLNTIESVLLDQ